MTYKLFVYGTLVGTRPDAEPATLKNAEKITDGGYPTIKPSKGKQVNGEIIEVNKTELQQLDRYESEGHLYHRIPINDNHSVEAYIGNPEMLGITDQIQTEFNKPELTQAFQQTKLEIQ